MTRALVAMLVLVALPAAGADEVRFSFLEREVRTVQQQVQTLQRQMDELTMRPARPAPQTSARAAPAITDLPRWVDAAKWQRLRPGMSELDVIGSLGAPTSMREAGGARVLFYALEIGASGFLGGSVTLRERAVVEVRQPTLQ
jgi:hypothetical protein